MLDAKDNDTMSAGKMMFVPDGWRVVPEEATPEMVEAGHEYVSRCGNYFSNPRPAGLFRAMVFKAPAVETVQQEKAA